MILHRARALLSSPDAWSGRHFAEDEAGGWVPVASPRAVRFNLYGALIKASWRDAPHALPQILELFGVVRPEVQARLKAASTASLTHWDAVSLLDDTMKHLSSPPVRKQSGFRLTAVGESAMRDAPVRKVRR